MAFLKLGRLQARIPLVNRDDGTGTNLLITLINRAFANIESGFQDVADALAKYGIIVGRVDSLDTASSDQADRLTAIETVNVSQEGEIAANKAAITIATSYVSPNAILSASIDTGLTTATVTVAGHSRVYDGTGVSVSGGSVGSLALDTQYWVYYDQSSRAGGSVTYHASATLTDAAQHGDRHFVGRIRTPATGAGATSGVGCLPPGLSVPV